MVQLENPLVCFNGDGYWLLSNSFFHGLCVLFGHILVTSDTSLWDTSGARRCLACSTCCLVRIALFGANRVLLSILESIVHQATIAAHVAETLGTVHELLLA
jgi:hypothetical protein